MEKRNQLHIYCTDESRAKLIALAKADHRSMSSEIQMLIDQAFEAYNLKLQQTEQGKK